MRIPYDDRLDDLKYDDNPIVKSLKDLYSLINVIGIDGSNISSFSGLLNNAVTTPKIAASILQVTPDGPATITSIGGVQQLTFTTKIYETGIISGNATTDSFSVTSDTYATIDCLLEVTRSAVFDVLYMKIYEDDVSKGNIAATVYPASNLGYDRWIGMYKLLAGKTYKIYFVPNGASGVHTCVYTYFADFKVICHGG